MNFCLRGGIEYGGEERSIVIYNQKQVVALLDIRVGPRSPHT
jgi:hypothetical protein